MVGCSFPTVIKEGKSCTFGNLSPEWVGVQVDELFASHCQNVQFTIANDADLAGIAEMELGAGKGHKGMVLMITIGTGLGSGLFYNGQLIPNMELGRIFHTDGKIIELYAADSARKREGLKLKEWALRFDFYLKHLSTTCTPDLFIIGGGLSKKFDKFKEYLTVEVPVTVAHFKNNAGIIGAAVHGARKSVNKKT